MNASALAIDRTLAWVAVRSIGLVVHGASLTARALARARGDLRTLSVQREVAYGPRPEHRLDVVQLRKVQFPPRVLLYFHGGGFQQLSRHTHWWFAARFARAGFIVLNADYRLAPRHAYPAAAADAQLAFEFATRYAAQLGVDSGEVTVAGESAGANLALGLAITGQPVKPRAVVLFSGLLQVSQPARLFREQALSPIVRARIASIARDYARRGVEDPPPLHPDPRLDPLLWLEHNATIAENLPAIYASAGSLDPVVSDTRRLEIALAAAGAVRRVEIYPGEGHAFQALPFREQAEQSWASCLAFLSQ